MPAVTVLSLTAQEPKATALNPSVQELKGACQSKRPLLTSPPTQGTQYTH